jgi:hypothetical protein
MRANVGRGTAQATATECAKIGCALPRQQQRANRRRFAAAARRARAIDLSLTAPSGRDGTCSDRAFRRPALLSRTRDGRGDRRIWRRDGRLEFRQRKLAAGLQEMRHSGLSEERQPAAMSSIESRQRGAIAQDNAPGRCQADGGVILKLRHRTRHGFDRQAQIVGNVLA